MRVGVVSHTYVLAANRGKLGALADRPDVDLLVIVPHRWMNRDIGQALSADPARTAAFPLAVVRAGQPLGSASLLVYAPFALLRSLRAFRPDLLYVEEEPWSLAALELALCSRVLAVPLVFFTWDNGDRRLPWPVAWVRRVVLGTARAAVAGSRGASARLERLGFRRPVVVLPQLGVNPDLFSPRQGDGATPPVVGYVGRLVPEKGVMLLVEACARLPANVRLMLVGTGPLKADVLRHAAALGLNGRVEIHDAVRHDEVPRYLHRMSVLALPSLTTAVWREQFGHALVEAMACGIPVVASDSGAIPEVVNDAGILFAEGKVEALCLALTEVLGNPGRRRDLASRGRARAVEKYADAIIAERLAAFWRQLLSNEG